MEKYDSYWFLAVFITPLIAWEFKMNFLETAVCSLLVLFISWLMKKLIKKRLYSIILIDDPKKDRCRATILLWNNSILRDVFYSDFGFEGIRIVATSETIIQNMSMKEITAKDFLFGNIRNSNSNPVVIPMGDINCGTLIEIKFTIVNSPGIHENRIILLPPGVDLPGSSFERKPSVNLLYDRKILNIAKLKYSMSAKKLYWLLLILAVIIAVSMTVYFALIIVMTLPYTDRVIFMLFGLYFSSLILSLFIVIRDNIPSYVEKHLKSMKK
ncbi:MAG: hypothetical protein LBR74_05655 [Eubacterium sp.]|nr:hypothetical protein [Eubacterium sp.]